MRRHPAVLMPLVIVTTAVMACMGCGLFPAVTITKQPLTDDQWHTLVDHVKSLSPGAHPNHPWNLHIVVSDPAEPVTVKLKLPLLYLRTGKAVVTRLEPWDKVDCDRACQTVLTSDLFENLLVPGMSIIVEDNQERVLLWVE